MNNPKERTAWIKAQEAAADEDPHGYPEPGEPNESTEERMQRFFFQQVTEGNATADGDGVQTLTVTITLAEYRRLAQQDGKLEYLQEQLDKKEEALTFAHQKSIEDDKAASNYRRQIEDLNRDRRNLAENAGSINMDLPERMVLLSVLPIHHAYCLCLDVLKAISLGSIICFNDSLLRVMKNIQLFKPEMILMVPLMIETIAKKLEDNTLLPPKLVKNAVFGKQLTKISSGGAYLDPSYIDLFEKYGITILQGYGMTECSPVISTTRPWNINKKAVGQLIDNCEAKTVGPGQQRDAGLLQDARGDRRHPGGRLAEDRRPGLRGRGGLCLPHRPEEEPHHHQKRRERLPRGAGKQAGRGASHPGGAGAGEQERH